MMGADMLQNTILAFTEEKSRKQACRVVRERDSVWFYTVFLNLLLNPFQNFLRTKILAKSQYIVMTALLSDVYFNTLHFKYHKAIGKAIGTSEQLSLHLIFLYLKI